MLLSIVFCIAWFAATRLWWMPVHGGADANGYLVGARELLATGEPCQRPVNPDTGRPDPFAFVGTMWIGVDLGGPDERYYPYYPLGMLGVYAAAMWMGGTEHALTAAYLVNPLALAAGLFGTFLLARRFLGPWLGLFATVLVGMSPTVLHLANETRSHGLSFALTVYGTVLLLRAWRTSAWPWSLAAGALLGAAVTVRYGTCFMVVPAAVMLGLDLRDQRFSHRSLATALWFIVGWSIPVLGLVATNIDTMGMTTAYDSTGLSTAFSFETLQSKSALSAEQLWHYGLFLLLPLAAMGLIRLLVVRPCAGMFLGAMLVAGWLFSASYYWASPRRPYNTTRFYLELFPAFAVCALSLFEKRPGESPRSRAVRLASLAVVSIATAVQFVTSFAPAVHQLRQNQRDLTRRLEIVREEVPEGSVLFSSDVTLLHDLQQRGSYRLYANRTFVPSRAGKEDSEEDYRRDQARDSRLHQAAQEAGSTVSDMRDVIFRTALDHHRQVFVVTTEDEDLALFTPYSFATVASHFAAVPLPANRKVGPKPPASWRLFRVEGPE